jgi:hypothetical protein
VDDEISFEEHSKKHTVPSPARLSCRVYTTFNLNNPDFNNFKLYHNFLGNHPKIVTPDT